MAEKKTARVGKSYLGITGQLTVNNIRMQAQDVASWVRAIDAARNEINPRRRLLYELYDQIKIDGHLEAVMNKRKIAITNKRVRFEEANKHGQENEYVRDFILETPWFYRLLGYIQEAKAFGHSLIELIPDGEGGIKKVALVPRVNVRPELGFLMYHYSNENEGFDYREDEEYAKYLIEAGGEKEYGLLMIAAQYVIYKRGGFGDWAQFAEIFGMPFRVGKYNPYDDATRIKLEEALREMGGAGHAVIPDGTSLEFFNPTNSGQSDVFKDLVQEANSELSKIFLGQTMTTDNGSSHSQSGTHKEVEEMINMADMLEAEYLLNWELADKLRALGLLIPEGRFYFEQSEVLSLLDRLKIDIDVSQKVKFKPEYWYETYGIEVPEGGAMEMAEESDQQLEEKLEQGKKKSLKSPTNSLEIGCCHIAHPLNMQEYPVAITAMITHQEEELIKKIHGAKAGIYDAESLQKTTEELKGGIRESFAVSAGYMQPDYLMGTMMELNINRFGFDKSLAQISALNQALDPGETFYEFKKKADTILEVYNRNYLETEHQHAVAVAQNAAAWQRQKAERDQYPFVQYQTVGDDHVRPSHQALDGKVFRINDESWSDIYPPNGYNCRCEMIQLTADQAGQLEVINGEQAIKTLGEDWDRMVQTGFNANRGELSEVFALNKVYLNDHSPKAANTLNYKDAGLSPIPAELKAKRRALPKSKGATQESILADFATRKVATKVGERMLLKDYTGRAVAVSERALSSQIGEDKMNLWRNVAATIKNADEVWMIQTGKERAYYKYLKFYKGETMVVEVAVDQAQGMHLDNWYKVISEEEARSGVLIKSSH